MLNRPVIEEWIAALESGEHEQGEGRLRYRQEGTIKECCLGVLCDLPSVQAAVDGHWEEMYTDANGRLIFSFISDQTSQKQETALLGVVAAFVGLRAYGSYIDHNGEYVFHLGPHQDHYSDLTNANDNSVSFVDIAQGLRQLLVDAIVVDAAVEESHAE